MNAPAADNRDPSTVQAPTHQPINVVGIENPLSIKIGGAEFTPGGFVDLTGIFRSRERWHSGLGTNFTSLPLQQHVARWDDSRSSALRDKARVCHLKVDAQPGIHGCNRLLRKRFQRL